MDHLPFSLQHLSPTLAAFHANRIRRLNPDTVAFDGTHCSRCGFFILDGRSNIRTSSSKIQKTNSRRRVLVRTCGSCGFIDSSPLDRGNAILFPRRSNGARPPPKTIIGQPRPTPIASPAPVPSSSTTASSPNPPKHKRKKSALQEMLARNRTRQEQEKKSNSQTEGSLASFLGGL